MIVSHTNKFIFIKTAKTAGTSMIIYLAQFCKDGDIVTHLKKEEIEYAQKLGYPFPNGLRSMVEDAKLSFWKLLVQSRNDPQLLKSDKRKVKKNLSAYSARLFLRPDVWNSYFKFCFERNPFDKAVSLYYWHTRNLDKKPEINAYIQSMPQSKLSNWELYTIDNQVAVDYVGRYESLVDDISFIIKKIGAPRLDFPNAKTNSRSNHQHYSQLLNRDTRHHIETMCEKELEYFHYEWEDVK